MFPVSNTQMSLLRRGAGPGVVGRAAPAECSKRRSCPSDEFPPAISSTVQLESNLSGSFSPGMTVQKIARL